MQDCPQCDSAVEDSAYYCTRCGALLNAGITLEEIDDATGFLREDDYHIITELIHGNQDTLPGSLCAQIHAEVKEALYDFVVLYHWEAFDPSLSLSPDVDSKDVISLSSKEELELETLPCLFALLYEALGKDVCEDMLQHGIARGESGDLHPQDDIEVTISIDSEGGS
ncbi:zinc ribbon domain-containing protein [Halorhabdus amylolytica]|uniref:zinc ribbon domain-containing protein n=1 Tax=Halorhabdus amylolytica TaxID=2559573 RepID=UPI0010AB0825|nr:zinc ribbon domain-containing protein [Halorhabdus amylolytica]